MKFATTILPLAALSTAFVIPEQETAQQLKLEKTLSFLDNVRDNVKDIWSSTEEKVHEAIRVGENAFDTAIESATKAGKDAAKSIEDYNTMARFETQQWLDSATSTIGSLDHPHPPHHGPHHGPHHPPPHDGDHKPNQTIYQLISSSKYTTKFTKLIDEFPDFVKALNSTGVANYTVFAPTDNAFDKLPEHHEKPKKEILEKILSYHISKEFYPAGRILVSHTIPTIFNSSELGGNAQRLRVGLSLKGLAVNFYSRVEAVNIFGTNGVIHGVDSILIPPPEILKIIDVLPGEFSTLQLALIKTGLGEELEKAKHNHGATFFAPSNFAFQKLGARINAFLFSERGLKYLEALLKYHIVGGETLYSDAYYAHDNKPKTKEHFHFDLPTLLDGKSLSVDIGSFAGFLSYRINGFSDVSILDGVARDGVIQVVSSVLIPPKSPGESAVKVTEDMDIEEFKRLLIPQTEEL